MYSTYLGGSAFDTTEAIAIDGSGNAYVTGFTRSTNFPTQNPYQGTHAGGTYDAFITKLSPSGSALSYSTFLGGSEWDRGYGLAVDGSGNAYVTGYTWSTNFPTQNPYQGTHAGGTYDAFISKFSSSGSALSYSTYLGGSGYDYGYAIAVDLAGNAYVTGYTESSNFPVQNAFQGTLGGGGYCDAFISKFSSSGSALSYSTFLGGSGEDRGYGIAVDASGNAYVTGHTTSINFPTQNPYQGTHAEGTYDAFITKLSSSGSALSYSTYLGGSHWDKGWGIAIDGSGNAYVTGETSSSDFPTQNPYQETIAGSRDAFVAKFFSDGSLTVTTTVVSSISSSSATSGGIVTADGGASVTARGVCWSTSANPTISGSKTSDGTGTGIFTSSITGLIPGTAYHVRAYATNGAGTSYGSDITFTTVAPVLKTFNFTGEVTEVSDSAIFGGVVVGDRISGSYTFDATTAPKNALAYWYEFANEASTQMNVQVGTLSLTQPFKIGVYDDAVVGVVQDLYAVNSGDDVSSEEIHVNMEVEGYTPNYITSLDLPLTPPSVTGAQIIRANIQLYLDDWANSLNGSLRASWETLDVTPAVTTTPVSSILATSATSGGTVTDGGGSAAVSARGVCWSTSANPTVTGGHTTDGTGTGSFTSSMTGLSPGTVYHVRAYATNSEGVGYGSDMSFTTSAEAPSAATDAATSVTTGSAGLNGTVNANGASTTVEFEYGTTTGYGNMVTASESPLSGISSQPVSKAISGLTSNTTYHFRVKATNSMGTTHGSDVSFVTSADAPSASTSEATSVTSGSATLNGAVNPNGTATEIIFEYGTTTSYGNTATAGQSPLSGSGSQAVSKGITGLAPGTTYHCRVKATNSKGTAYGSDVSFTTSPTAPTGATGSAAPVGSSTATLNGTVNPNGASTTVLFEYGATTNYGSTVTADQSPATGTSSQSVSKEISGLSPATTYHFRVKATNSAGTASGSDGSFTTAASGPTTVTSAANPVAASSATLNGTVNPNGASTTVTFQYGTTTGYGSTVTAVPGTMTGTSSQSASAGISGLNANTTYYFRIKAVNTAGSSYGSAQSFTTASAAPAVVTGSAGSVSTDGATLNGTVNPNGLATTHYFQYGKTASYGLLTTPVSAGSGSTQISVNGQITDLTSDTAYHYRLVAFNSLGTVYGDDKTLTTSAPPVTKPTVTTGWATSVTGNAAKFNGTMNPNGAETTYYFQYGTTTSYGSTTTSKGAGIGTSDVSVNEDLSGLIANTTYHFRLVGTNSAGTTYGNDQSFTTGTTAKAIIVAGGGPYAGNNIWDITQMIAAYAFKALVYQGYTKDSIYYLSPNTSHDVDGGGSDVDAAATLSNLENAIKVWAKDASDLFLYMIDHGGIGSFRLSPSETLLATNLDSWLDTLQNDGVEKVVVVYDACHSGSFLPDLTPPDGKARVLATSATSGQNSLFSARGTLSFSYLFWSNMFNGDSFYSAFVKAKDAVGMAYPNRMKPLVEANWNGTGNEKDDKTLAEQVAVGLGIFSASGLPTIESISPLQTVVVGNSAGIYAENVVAIAEVNRVWAVITPPDFANSDEPVTDLPVCEMSGGSGQYQGTYSGFNAEGTYNIAVFVEDKDGFLSVPLTTTVNAIIPITTTTTTTTTTSTTTTSTNPTTTTTTSTTTTTLPAPSVITGSANPVGTATATLSGTVRPNGVNTGYSFQYGRSGIYGLTTTNTSVGAGSGEVYVSENVAGLEPGAEYHFRIVGASSVGTSYGSNQTFKTAYASVIFVKQNDDTCDGNSPCHTTIQAAIDAADTGVSIKIAGGTYDESFVLNESKLLTLSGGWNDGFTDQTGEATVINAPRAAQGSLTIQNVNIMP